MADEPALGRVLAVLRETRGMNKAQLARATGIAASVLSEYEGLKRTPRLKNVQRILRALDYDLQAVEETRRYLAALGRYENLAIAEERRAAPLLYQRLRRLPQKARRGFVTQHKEFHTWALCEYLCLESARTAPSNAADALELAELAVHVAERIKDAPWSPQLRWFSWAHLGNARRVVGDPRAAGAAFATADSLYSGNPPRPKLPLEEARVYGMKASLRSAQRRFVEAFDLTEQALAIDGGGPLRPSLLVNKATLLEVKGDLEGAIALLEESAPSVLATKDPRLILCLRHNLMDFLTRADRPEEANALLPEVTKLAHSVGGDLDRLRLRWLTGRILSGLGKKEEAVEVLTMVRAEFASLGIMYDGALATLELATVFAEMGRSAEVKALARHLVPLFQAEDVHREALAALTIFRRAAEQEQVTVELARRITHFLRRAQYDPELRFA